MFDFFWDLYQQRQITKLKADLVRARHEGAPGANRKLDDLERRADLLAITTAAMWSLVAGRLGLSDADLQAEIRRLDLTDGVEDGRMNPPRNCPSCARPVARRLSRCIYCGTHVGQPL